MVSSVAPFASMQELAGRLRTRGPVVETPAVFLVGRGLVRGLWMVGFGGAKSWRRFCPLIEFWGQVGGGVGSGVVECDLVLFECRS